MKDEQHQLLSIEPRPEVTSLVRAPGKFVSLRLLVTIALLLGPTSLAHAQNDWSGLVSDDWFLSGNWIGGIPSQTTSANLDTVSPFATVVEGQAALLRNLVIGQDSTGMLTVRGGGTVTASLVAIGNLGGSHGTVMVTGVGSDFTANGSIVVGGRATGTITVENSATLNSAGGSIGQSTGSIGTMAVTGAGSTWTNGPSGGLNIGSLGTGTLTIADGGAVRDISIGGVKVGNNPGSIGMTTVTGAGSIFRSKVPIVIGNIGNGALTVANGGVVNAAIGIAAAASSVGTVNIGAGAGSPAAAPGTLDTPSITFGTGTGTINFNHMSANYVFAPAISGPGSVNVLAGTSIFTGVSTYSGITTVNAGTLLVNSPGSIASPVLVNNGGTLGGTGTVGNTVTVTSGGTLAPGASPGVLNTHTLTLNAGSTLAIEINGPTVGTQYDQVNVTGSVQLNNATLNVVPGFTPSAGQAFTIIANDLSDAVVGTFSGLPEGSTFIIGGSRFRISYVGGTGNDVTLAVIGPPTIAKTFGTLSILVNTTTTLTFTLTNPNTGTALTGVGFNDTLPAGVVVATPNGLESTCGGTLSAIAGSGTIGLTNGGLAAGDVCTISVDVTGLSGGLKANTTSAVTSIEGGTGATAKAFLVVVAPPAVAPPTIAKSFGAGTIALNETTSLTFTLNNPNPESALSGVGFTDTLPGGMVVATPNELTSTCGGTPTAVTGSGSVALANGDLPASSSCSITVNVAGVTPGAKNNITSAVSSIEGGTGGTASASLTVTAAAAIAAIPTLSHLALTLLTILLLLAGLRREATQ